MAAPRQHKLHFVQWNRVVVFMVLMNLIFSVDLCRGSNESKIFKNSSTSNMKNKCRTDKDCPTGTVCIVVRINSDQEVSKCTPDNIQVRACRGKNYGRCPSFQASDSPWGLLNTQCVFINTTMKMNVKCCGATSTSTSTPTPSKSKDTTSDSSSTLAPPVSRKLIEDDDDCQICFVDKGHSYAGQYECIPIEQCSSHKDNYFKDLSCGEKNIDCTSGYNSFCNDQGTCAPKNKNSPTTFRCYCYKGFDDFKCGKVISNECDVDCGKGGVTSLGCEDGQCVCKKGWIGKQCLTCNHDASCNAVENPDNQCVSGKCKCASGFKGFTCSQSVVEEIVEGEMCDKDCGSKASCEELKCKCNKCAGSNCESCTGPEDCDRICPSSAVATGIPLLLVGLLAFLQLHHTL